MNEFAPGIPEKGKITDFPKSENQTWTANIQRHDAERAGRHYDLRLNPPNSSTAYSWALPKGMPSPGQKNSAIRTNDHTKEYMGFSGDIPEGYGKGKVTSEFHDKVEVLKSAPEDKIYFNIYQGRDTGRYFMKKYRDNEWMIYNYTPTEKTKEYEDVPNYKRHYPTKKVEETDPEKSPSTEKWSPKLDGAHNTIVLRPGKRPDVFSYRSSRRGDERIDHTFRIPLYKETSPKDLKKTILRGELYSPGQPGQAVSTILNSNVWKSRESKPLEIAAFDVVKYDGKYVEDLPYKEKFKMLQEISKKIPKIKLPPLAKTKEQKKKLLEDIKEKRHPLTQEGIVIFDDDSPLPKKVKITDDWDMRITGTFPAKPGSKYEGKGIGGFEGKVENPLGIPDIKLKVGTGLSDQIREEAYRNPEKFINQWAKITSERIHPSGKHQAPVLKEFRAEKYMNKAAAINIRKFRNDLGIAREAVKSVEASPNPDRAKDLLKQLTRKRMWYRRQVSDDKDWNKIDMIKDLERKVRPLALHKVASGVSMDKLTRAATNRILRGSVNKPKTHKQLSNIRNKLVLDIAQINKALDSRQPPEIRRILQRGKSDEMKKLKGTNFFLERLKTASQDIKQIVRERNPMTGPVVSHAASAAAISGLGSAAWQGISEARNFRHPDFLKSVARSGKGGLIGGALLGAGVGAYGVNKRRKADRDILKKFAKKDKVKGFLESETIISKALEDRPSKDKWTDAGILAGSSAIGAGIGYVTIADLVKKMRRNAFLRDTGKAVPIALSLPSILTGLSGGFMVGAAGTNKRQKNYFESKGIFQDRWGRVKKANLNLSGFLGEYAPIIGGAAGGFAGGEKYESEGMAAGALLGTAAGLYAGRKLTANTYKAIQKIIRDRWRAAHGGPPVVRKTSPSQAAEDLGLRYRGGKFYTPDGSQIKTKNEMRRHYRRRSMETHPDRGGDAKEFDKVQKAFKDSIQGSSEWNKLAHVLKKVAAKYDDYEEERAIARFLDEQATKDKIRQYAKIMGPIAVGAGLGVTAAAKYNRTWPTVAALIPATVGGALWGSHDETISAERAGFKFDFDPKKDVEEWGRATYIPPKYLKD